MIGIFHESPADLSFIRRDFGQHTHLLEDMSFFASRLILHLWIIGCAFVTSSVLDGPISSAFLDQHCIACHDADVKKGGLDLSSLDANDVAAWTKVHDRVASGEMPPPKKKRPAANELTAFLKEMTSQITAKETEKRSLAGRTVFRRLNRTEYEHTLRDLLHLPHLDVREMLPADGELGGFDTVSQALELSHVQIARYLDAAELALDLATASTEQPPLMKVKWPFVQEGRFYEMDQETKQRVPGGRGSSRVVDEWIVFLRQPNEAQTPWFFGKKLDYAGEYRFRVRCRATRYDRGQLLPPTRSHIASLRTSEGKRLLHMWDVSPEPQIIEFTARMQAGDRPAFFAESLDDRHDMGEGKHSPGPYTGEGIAVEYVECEGPIFPTWPPPSHHALFSDLPLVKWTPQSGVNALRPYTHHAKRPAERYLVMPRDAKADAKRLLHRFIERTLPHGLSDEAEQQHLRHVITALDAKVPFQEAMRRGFKSVLCSPDFLFYQEKPGTLDATSLARRLAAFLWRSSPDQALLATARDGSLLKSEVLRAQTERLLADPRHLRFVNDFTAQWLDLRRIAFTQPDKKLYPEFRTVHQDSMVQETQAWFDLMLTRDLSADHVVSSRFILANQPLAQLYGLEGVKGLALREVPLPPDSVRGGFLTQGAVLKVTANGTTTSPVTRGVWIQERLLGHHIPPPPPGAGSIDPDVRGTTTIREQLDKHRSSASCAACHAKIDPPGFALESFDVIGGWRDRYRSMEKGDAPQLLLDERKVSYKLGPAVDCTGSTVDGKAFRDIREFRQHLLADQRQIARNLAERLTTFATGAVIQFSDRREIEAMLTETQKSGHGLRSLVHATIQSPIFRQK